MQATETPDVKATDVLIVGAGPTGLTAALVLAQSGVRVRVVERDAGPIDESRAVIVHGRTQEFFDKLGLVDEALEKGQPIDGVHILVNGQERGHMPIRGKESETPYHLPLVFEQSKTQRLLIAGLERAGVAVEWSTEFLGLSQNEGGVTATLRLKDQEETVHARYLIGADGARSPVRRGVGIGFEGTTYEHAFFLADVDVDWARGHEQIYANITKDHFIQFFPMYGDKNFRIIGTLTPEQSGWENVSLDDVQKIVSESGVEATLSNDRWTALYRIHKRHVKRFREGRVFLAGDSAHIHSPAGGQGVNMSVQDSVNLAWKLAAVVKGRAGEALLESYEAERMPIVEQTLRTSDRAFELQATSSPFLKRARLAIAPIAARLLSTLPGGQNLLFDFVSQIGVGYPKSPIVEAADGAKEVRAGERAPYGFLEVDGEKVSLFELFRGVEHQLLFFESEARADFDKRCLEAQAVAAYTRVNAQPIKIRADNVALHKTYEVTEPTVLLVRPDGYIGYRGALNRPDLLLHYLRRFYTLAQPGAQAETPREVAAVGA